MPDACAELSGDSGQALRAILSFGPARPVLSALSEACVSRWTQAVELVRRLQEHPPSGPAEFTARGNELVSAFEDWEELLRWALAYREPLSDEEADRLVVSLTREGMSLIQALESRRMSMRRHRGAPARKRYAAIAAYEVRLSNPRTSWRELAQRFCRCRANQHTSRCVEALRCKVKHLKAFLRKYDIEVAISSSTHRK